MYLISLQNVHKLSGERILSEIYSYNMYGRASSFISEEVAFTHESYARQVIVHDQYVQDSRTCSRDPTT